MKKPKLHLLKADFQNMRILSKKFKKSFQSILISNDKSKQRSI